MASTSAGSSTAETSTDIATEAVQLMGQGKRHLVMGEVPVAVNCLQEASALLAAKYGELADECGEVYFDYGRALLELGRMETGVLGNALEGVPEEDEDDVEEEEGNVEKPEKVPDDCEKPGTSCDEKEADTTTEAAADNIKEKDEETVEEEEEEGMEEGDGATTTEGMEEGDGATTTEGEAESKEESEDVSNFQLAWEMLELAKVIFSRKDGKEGDLRVAQCYLKLGEVGLETENYAQSAKDFQECLNLQKIHLEPENRLLAESHYQIGLANSFNRSFDTAILHLQSAQKVIEDRLALITKRIEENEAGKGKEKASTDDPLVADQKESQELRDLIPDIMAKIEDAEEMKKSDELAAKTSIEAAAAEFGVSSSSGDATQKKAESSEPVKDISHLVRRKRKPEEESPKEDGTTDSKKARSEETGNGDVNTNGVNGDDKVNGVNGIDKSPEKGKEIQTKTVEDVKKDDAKKDEAAAVPMETAQ
ncbi:protein HGV2-like isoform X2 [Glandiceps talaboti]